MKDKLKQQWQRFSDKADAMSLRERVMVFLMLAAVLGVLLNAVLLDPLVAGQKKHSRDIVERQAQIADIQARTQVLASAAQADPDAANRERLKALKQKLEQSDKALNDVQQGLVPPERMARLLEDILERNRGLRLVSLKTLPAGALLGAPVAGAGEKGAATAGQVYRHGIQITVEGNYAELSQYLAELEKLPWRMFWSQADMRVDEYPKVVLTLTVYTLSLDQSWLAV